jgi:hypothetical protein
MLFTKLDVVDEVVEDEVVEDEVLDVEDTLVEVRAKIDPATTIIAAIATMYMTSRFLGI